MHPSRGSSDLDRYRRPHRCGLFLPSWSYGMLLWLPMLQASSCPLNEDLPRHLPAHLPAGFHVAECHVGCHVSCHVSCHAGCHVIRHHLYFRLTSKVLLIYSLVLHMVIAYIILKRTFTQNSNIQNLNRCFGKPHVQILNQNSIMSFKKWLKSMTEPPLGFSTMPTPFIGPNSSLLDNVSDT